MSRAISSATQRYLSNNRISSVDSSPFSGLSKLKDLSSEPSSLPTHEHHHHEEMDLGHNTIETLPDNLFSGLSSLGTLFLLIISFLSRTSPLSVSPPEHYWISPTRRVLWSQLTFFPLRLPRCCCCSHPYHPSHAIMICFHHSTAIASAPSRQAHSLVSTRS